MNEGELYKKIREMQHLQEFHVWYHDDLKKTFDEARKEFPVFWLTKEGEIYSISSGLEKKAIQWFLKWFGDQPLP